MSAPEYVCLSPDVRVVVTSFGYLHGPAPEADITVDVREHLRDPHPEFRELTGHDLAVVDRVLATAGALDLIAGLVACAAALAGPARAIGRLVTVAVGCAGGRHRSVVIADAVAARLALGGVGAEAEHLHLTRPTAQRREAVMEIYDDGPGPTCPAELPPRLPWHVLARFAQSCLTQIGIAHERGRQAHPETHLLFLVDLAGLAERARRALWPAVIDAYGAGVTRDRLAHAIGVTPEEFEVALAEFIRGSRDDDPQRADAATRLLNDSRRRGDENA